jgi:hypothetical protein
VWEDKRLHVVVKIMNLLSVEKGLREKTELRATVLLLTALEPTHHDIYDM